MKTFSHLWQYLAEFFLEWEMFQIKVVEEIKPHTSMFNNVFQNRAVYEKMSENMVESERMQIICRLRVAYWISKQARARVRAPTSNHQPIPPPPPPPHTHTRTHTHVPKQARASARTKICTRWFKYDRDKLWLVYTQIVPVIFEPPCNTDCFPRQRWFREHTWILRYTYVDSLVLPDVKTICSFRNPSMSNIPQTVDNTLFSVCADISESLWVTDCIQYRGMCLMLWVYQAMAYWIEIKHDGKSPKMLLSSSAIHIC
jgi:hypothetical protein